MCCWKYAMWLRCSEVLGGVDSRLSTASILLLGVGAAGGRANHGTSERCHSLAFRLAEPEPPRGAELHEGVAREWNGAIAIDDVHVKAHFESQIDPA